ncbi:MAG: rpoE 1 [Phycisphaerales bacterium]|nr:rpoE 1 [Phycisphaerales bacterium]
MSQLSEADQYLLERIRRSDGEAWSQLVTKFQGRLLAFARAQRVRDADAEDFVQDTFFRFLRGLDSYRGDASLETYLFLLLRRRIIDAARGSHVHACAAAEGGDDASADMGNVRFDASASWYVRRDEQRTRERAALAQTIIALIETLRQELNFRDLQLVEMLFYAQMRNEAIATVTGLDNKYIGLLKHRWIKQLRARIISALDSPGDAGDVRQDSLLSEIWEQYRPSCPKRTTLGGYLLGTLDEPWTRYVKFHVETLGCRFCTANLDDLRRETAAAHDVFRDRVLQSTVGFFRSS